MDPQRSIHKSNKDGVEVEDQNVEMKAVNKNNASRKMIGVSYLLPNAYWEGTPHEPTNERFKALSVLKRQHNDLQDKSNIKTQVDSQFTGLEFEKRKHGLTKEQLKELRSQLKNEKKKHSATEAIGSRLKVSLTDETRSHTSTKQQVGELKELLSKEKKSHECSLRGIKNLIRDCKMRKDEMAKMQEENHKNIRELSLQITQNRQMDRAARQLTQSQHNEIELKLSVETASHEVTKQTLAKQRCEPLTSREELAACKQLIANLSDERKKDKENLSLVNKEVAELHLRQEEDLRNKVLAKKEISKLIEEINIAKQNIEKEKSKTQRERINHDVTCHKLLDMQFKYLSEFEKHQITQQIGDKKCQELTTELIKSKILIDKLLKEKATLQNELNKEKQCRRSTEQRALRLEESLTKTNVLNGQLQKRQKDNNELHQKQVDSKQQILDKLSRDKTVIDDAMEQIKQTCESTKQHTGKLEESLAKERHGNKTMLKTFKSIFEDCQVSKQEIATILSVNYLKMKELEAQVQQTREDDGKLLHQKERIIEDLKKDKTLTESAFQKEKEKAIDQMSKIKEDFALKLKSLSVKHDKLQRNFQQREMQVRSCLEENTKLKKIDTKEKARMTRQQDELNIMKEELNRQKMMNKSFLKQQAAHRAEIRCRDEELLKTKTKLEATKKYVASLKEIKEPTKWKDDVQKSHSNDCNKSKRKKKKSKSRVMKQIAIQGTPNRIPHKEVEPMNREQNKGYIIMENEHIKNKAESKNSKLIKVDKKDVTKKKDIGRRTKEEPLNEKEERMVEYEDDREEDEGEEIMSWWKVMLFILFTTLFIFCFDLYVASHGVDIWDLSQVNFDQLPQVSNGL